MRILIVEDDFVSRNVLTRLLAAHGQVLVAEDGASALARFDEARAAGRPFDLVTLDIAIRGVRGQEVLQAMREREHHPPAADGHRATIVMTTGLDDVKNVSAAFRDLCDAYLVKPIRRAVLEEKLHELRIPSTD